MSYSLAGTTTSYAYDENNKRVRMGTDVDVIHYPNDLYSLDTGLQIPTRHVFLNGKDIVTITGATSSDSVAYNFTDSLNSTGVTADKNNRVQEVTDYTPYGALNNHDQLAGYTEQRKYIGQPLDTDTNLSYLSARYYNAAQGQFLSEDPVFVAMGDNSKLKSLAGLNISQQLKDPQKLNSYNYSEANPITHEDPSGLDNDFGLTSFFNSYDPTASAEANQYIAQAKAQALAVSVAVPFGAQMGAELISSEAIAPELFPVTGLAYQGASFSVASRAVHNAMPGEQSTWGQYAGSAVIGGFTAGVTAEAKLSLTMSAAFGASLSESAFVDGSVLLSKAFVDSIAAGGGKMAGQAVASSPMFSPLYP